MSKRQTIISLSLLTIIVCEIQDPYPVPFPGVDCCERSRGEYPALTIHTLTTMKLGWFCCCVDFYLVLVGHLNVSFSDLVYEQMGKEAGRG